MSSTDKQIQKLEDEIKALKASFQQSAVMMNIYTTDIQFDTAMNVTNWSNSGSYNPLQWGTLVAMYTLQNGTRFDTETLEVTFTCADGYNTYATLEVDDITPGKETSFFRFYYHRVPYNGGARWIVSVAPNADLVGGTGYYTWAKSTLRFAVQSPAKGTLGVKMIWQ